MTTNDSLVIRSLSETGLLRLCGRSLVNPTVTVYVTSSIILPVHIPEVLEHVSELLPSSLVALTVVVVTGQRKPVFGQMTMILLLQQTLKFGCSKFNHL